MATKDLGAVTAYAYAKAHGYSGTEAQFETKMGELPQAVLDAQNAVTTVTGVQAQATQLATTAAPTATYNHTTNKIEFGIPKGNGIASITHTGTSGTVKTYTITFNDGQTTTFDVTDGELTYEYAEENLAFIDGYYDELTSGSAEQLISTQAIEDEEPYIFRAAGGTADIGNRMNDMLIGGTVGWNQLVQNGNFASQANWVLQDSRYATMSVSNNVLVLNIPGGVSASPFQYGIYQQNIINSSTRLHKFLLAIVAKPSVQTNFRIELGGSGTYWSPYVPANTKYRLETILTGAQYNSTYLIYPNSAVSGTAPAMTIEYSNAQVFDLTLMFGPEIADQLYAMEQAKSGSGIAVFKKYFPKQYYVYNSGSVQSVNVASHDTIGFNAWDEEWELGSINNSGVKAPDSTMIRSKNYIRVVPGETYYISCQSASNANFVIYCYDVNKTFVPVTGAGTYMNGLNHQDGSVPIPSNVHYILFRGNSTYGKIYKNDICINLYKSGYRNGEYEPYVKHSYPYDEDVILNGFLQLKGEELVYDGDIYESDGTITRKYGSVTITQNTTILGSSFISGGYVQYNTATLAGVGKNGGNILTNYYSKSASDSASTDTHISLYAENNTVRLLIRDSRFGNTITNLTQWNAWLTSNNLEVIYELATPIVETVSPFTNPQIVDDFGTEEYVDAGVKAGTRDVSIPVGHYTEYMANLRDKLQHLPNLSKEDGDYFIRQTGTDMKLKKAEGVYDRLTAGSSKQLLSTIKIEDRTPYLFRTSGGSVDIGDREEIEAIIGGSVAFNQQLLHGNFDSSAGISGRYSTITVSNNIGIATPASDGSDRGLNYNIRPSESANRKFFLSIYINSPIDSNVSISLNGGDLGRKSINATANTWVHLQTIAYTTSAAATLYSLVSNALTTSQQIKYKKAIAVDLTQMFGPTVADYLYSIESSNDGAGVAFFRSLFPQDYYEYNRGELMSVKGLISHDMRGFNAWDEEWEVGRWSQDIGSVCSKISDSTRFRNKTPIKVVPETTYYFGGSEYGIFIVLFCDKDLNIITIDNTASRADRTITTPKECAYINFYPYTSGENVYNNDIAINVSWDGERDGEYEPYSIVSYNLDDSLELHGVPKIDSSSNFYYDGDIYESDGIVTRKYKKLDVTDDLISLPNYNYDNITYAAITKPEDSATRGNITNYGLLHATYPVSKNSRGAGTWDTADNIGYMFYTAAYNQWWFGFSQGTTLAQAKAALSGTSIIYELKEPVIEEAASYAGTQIVDDFGTEEFVIDPEIEVPIPVGHITQYQPNLRAKLEMAPNSPDGDGDYIVRQTNGENEYVPLVFPTELPATPTTNGTYVLKVTVSNGTPTLSWVAN